MDLSSIQKSESPSKLLTPWWDVGIHYATTAMLVLSLAAIGLQTTKDGLVCLPKVDCGAVFERNQSVRNGNVSNDVLKVCSKLKEPGNERPCGTVVLTAMEDRRQYDYVEHKCYAQLPEFIQFFSLIFFGETLLLLFISNFWLKYPKTSCTLNHFEHLLSEFNYFEYQAFDDVVHGIKGTDYNRDDLGIKAFIFNRKVGYFKKQFDGTEKTHHKSFYSLTFQYRLRVLFGMIVSFVILICNTCYYRQHSIFSQCRLAKVPFLKGNEHFECTRPIHSHYSAMAFSFSVLVGVYFMFLIKAGYWAIKELGWRPQSKREAYIYNELVFDTENTSGDLAFLIKLLENSNALLQNMFDVRHLLSTFEGDDLQQENEAKDEIVNWVSSV